VFCFVFLPKVSLFIFCLFFAFGVFSVLCFELSVPVQVQGLKFADDTKIFVGVEDETDRDRLL